MKIFKILSTTAIFASLAFAGINLNTATKDELMALPGIGEAKAEAIIEYRKNNKFNSIDEIKNIKGIGDKRFEAIKDDLTLTGKTDTSDLKSTAKKEKEKATKKADKKVKKEVVNLKDKAASTDTAKKAKKVKDMADEAKKIKKAVSE
ncbi:ComEA family DNA-binding protein [Campylobacter sp. JMF_04 NA10]|uniref:ComEA family DNA-binding protein n=1 Tax=Campylobacter sp. JMF_04 NA10 TaxID=2983824 RepID=UPI003FA46413